MDIFDSIWRRRGRPGNNSESVPEEEHSYHITQTDRDYSELLERGDVAVKCWLPELMGAMLDETCAMLNTTRSDLIRQTLFTYLYGRYDWLGMCERKEHHYQLSPPPMTFFQSGAVQEPDAPDIMQDMGKNTEDLKVWIPRKMKEDIQLLAQKTEISLSEMIREILIATLIGHTYLLKRKELLQIRIEVEDGPEAT
jgi:hypothetical protein